MNRKFVELLGFRKFIDSQESPQQVLALIQAEILKDPEIGSVMAGTGGLRKFRVGLDNRGKSGGVRVVYVDFPEIQQDEYKRISC